MEKKLILLAALAILLVIAFIVFIAGKVNKPPTAEPLSVTTKEESPVSFTLKGSDRDKDPLTYSIITEPAHGRWTGTVPNLSYMPEPDFNGRDSFTFQVSDGKVNSAAATVTITVTPANDPPTANDDSAAAKEDTPIVMIDVLANDTDPDKNPLLILNATQGSNGSVTINTDSTLTYAPNRNFCGTDTFTYTMSDGNGGTDTATVNLTIEAVNDAPGITSKPLETTRVWNSYKYNVKAKDPDSGDSLSYSLLAKPEGMTIDPDTGLIEWRPTSSQAGTYDVLVKVEDTNSIPATDTQEFAVTVTSLDSPLTNTLTVTDCFNYKGNEKLSAKDKIPIVRTSDDERLETDSRSYTCYVFSDPSIPEEAAIKSVVVFVEHVEDPSFAKGKLVWSVGTGWPARPAVWASIEAPVRQGQSNDSTDSWDVTSAVETAEKANSFQLQIQNNDTAGTRKTFVDCVSVVVKWY